MIQSLKELIADLPDEPVPIRSVIVGAHWTVVCSRSCGLAVLRQRSTTTSPKTMRPSCTIQGANFRQGTGVRLRAFTRPGQF
ncbi:MAG TPA: DUF4213 domain-containing protein [Methanoregula sp.]|nr:DUF4213 domain-containing protein [Methanoregula sp.]